MGLSQPFGGIYAGRRVLVTGHTGFKGSWLTAWLQAMGSQVAGLALDPDTSPSHWAALKLEGVADHRVDLRDAAAVAEVLDLHQPEIVFHLAAQPLVRRSYREPVNTFDVNVMGLINLLEAIRQCPSVRVAINATTDKVYQEHDSATGYKESDPLGGHDPYSSSKACAEIVSACYQKSFLGDDDGRGFAVRLATARAGNVIGGGDWAEDRLVPDLIRAGQRRETLNIRNPDAIRPWQHVLEPLSGYLRLGQCLLEGECGAGAWNFGPGREGESTVQQVVNGLSSFWPWLCLAQDTGIHPHEAAALRLDNSKALAELAWQPVWDLNTAISRTADWYHEFLKSGQLVTGADIVKYTADATRKEVVWAV